MSNSLTDQATRVLTQNFADAATDEDRTALLEEMGVKSTPMAVGNVVIPPGSPYALTADGIFCDLDTSGYDGVLVQLSGIYSGFAINPEVSIDGTNWTSIAGQSLHTAVDGPVFGSSSGAGTLMLYPAPGLRFRLRANVVSNTGTITAAVALVADRKPLVGAFVAAVGASGHGAPIYRNPLRMAGRARSAALAAVTNDNVCDLITTLAGALIVRPYALPESEWSYVAATGGLVNTTTPVTVKAAASSGIRNYVTGITLQADALTNATEFIIRDGSGGGGVALWRIKIPTTGLPLTSIRFATPLKGTAATLLEITTLTASGAGAVFANLSGYTAP